MCLTETWLNDSISSSLIHVPNYNLCRADRCVRKGGGTAVFIRQDVHFVDKTEEYQAFMDIEFNVVDLCSMRVCLICAYIPPNLNSETHKNIHACLISITDDILKAKPNYNTMIVGDMNDFDVEKLCLDLAMKNLVTKATRKNNILDHILVTDGLASHYDSNNVFYDAPLANSDHLMISAVPTSNRSSFINASRLHMLYDFRQSHLAALLHAANAIDWVALLNNIDDVDKQVALLHECISNLVKAYIPIRNVVISSNDKPWITPLTKALIEDRWTAYRLKQWNKYEHLKIKVKHEILRAKEIWAHKLKATPNGLWKLVKSTGNTAAKTDFSNLIPNDGSIQNVLDRIKGNLTTIFTSSGHGNQLLCDDEWCLTFTEEEVNHMFHNLNSNKSTGIDNIPTKVYKLLADHLSQPFTKVFNACLSQRVFPNLWKKGIIIPVPKSNPACLNNLRYLSMLPVPSKILEKLVLKKMWPYFSAAYRIEQHGFRPGSSTTSALIQLTDDITSIYDDRKYSGAAVLSFDMSRAFDCVDHALVPQLLKDVHFPHGFIKWLQNYFTDRCGIVRLDGCYSSEVLINRGVPQGSVLGPPIFCTYIGSMKPCNEDVKIMKYADDITLVVPRDRVDDFAYVSKIEMEIGNIVSQADYLNLKLNLKKSKAMLILRPGIPNDLQLSIPIENSLKILGMFLTDKLKWDLHVKLMCKKACQRLHILRRLRQFVSLRENHEVYVSIVRSVLEYASPVFVGLNKTLSQKIQALDKRAHRIIYGSDRSNWQCQCDKDIMNQRRFLSSEKFLLHILGHPNHILYSRIPHKMNYTQLYSIPFCRTEKRRASFFPFIVAQLNFKSQ